MRIPAALNQFNNIKIWMDLLGIRRSIADEAHARILRKGKRHPYIIILEFFNLSSDNLFCLSLNTPGHVSHAPVEFP